MADAGEQSLVLGKAKERNYQIACQRHFEFAHKKQTVNGKKVVANLDGWAITHAGSRRRASTIKIYMRRNIPKKLRRGRKRKPRGLPLRTGAGRGTVLAN